MTPAQNMPQDRLTRQLDFLVQMDALKQVFRQTLLIGDRRPENDAEHSWHFALMAVVLAEHAEGDVDPLRVVKMALIHDLVEIDAGDTFAYDEAAHADKEERERAERRRHEDDERRRKAHSFEPNPFKKSN